LLGTEKVLFLNSPRQMNLEEKKALARSLAAIEGEENRPK